MKTQIFSLLVLLGTLNSFPAYAKFGALCESLFSIADFNSQIRNAFRNNSTCFHR